MGKSKGTGELFIDDNETDEDLLLALSGEELEREYNRIIGKVNSTDNKKE
ncbi:MAG: hypothetical protein IKC41_03040 [Clostridia bacterium]|nr:hypothetical protein [Clostridia bacterium]